MAQRQSNEPLMEDDVYPNDGAPFVVGEPETQKQERQVEKGKVLEGLPIMQDVIERFNTQIAFLDSLDSIPHNTRSDQDKLLMNFHANDLSRRFLRNEKEWLEGLIDDYFKQR